MKPRIYLESTIPSYLTGRPSRDALVAERQRLTREWWARSAGAYEFFISPTVTRECSDGDAEMADARLELITELTSLDETEETQRLASSLFDELSLPERAEDDAMHVALAAQYGLDILLTWNLKHLANVQMRQRIKKTCARMGYNAAVILTPAELAVREGVHGSE